MSNMCSDPTVYRYLYSIFLIPSTSQTWYHTWYHIKQFSTIHNPKLQNAILPLSR